MRHGARPQEEEPNQLNLWKALCVHLARSLASFLFLLFLSVFWCHRRDLSTYSPSNDNALGSSHVVPHDTIRYILMTYTPIKCIPMNYMSLRRIPMRYTPMRCTPIDTRPMRYTPMKYSPIRYAMRGIFSLLSVPILLRISPILPTPRVALIEISKF
jgi:hypothetical protein